MNFKKWGNLTGAFGDLGVLLPLLAALSAVNGLNFSVCLAAAGLAYAASALYYRLPVPVQPLKVACSLAIAYKLSPSVIQAASFEAGLVLLFLGVSGLASRLSGIFTKPVVRGMQMGVGLILMERGMALCFETLRFSSVTFGAAAGTWPGLSDLGTAFFVLVAPQLPVTLSNAVVGSESVARRYYRWNAKRATAGNLCLSMAAANLAMGFLGGFPVCHGSSGWTAHRRLGARGYLSTVFLGILFVGAAVLTGTGILALPEKMSGMFLGGLLVYVGIRHALLVRDCLRPRREALIAVASGAVSYGTRNPALGLACGLLLDRGLEFWRSRVPDMSAPLRQG